MDDLDKRLKALDRAPAIASTTLDDLASAVQREARASRRWRVRVIGASAVLALAGGIVAAPAAADAVRSFLAQSDWNPEPGGEILPDSEWVEVGAPDLEEYVDSIYPDYLELAPGQTREQIVSAVAGLWDGQKGLTQEVGLRLEMEIGVFCGWANEWTAAHSAGDEPRAAVAIDGMLLTTTWPAQAATNAGGIVERQIEIVGYASAGDVESFQFGVAQNNCSFVTPALDDE